MQLTSVRWSRGLSILTGAIWLGACGGDGGTMGRFCDLNPTAPECITVTSVTITFAADTLTAIGATTQVTAQALDNNGNSVSGVTFTYGSSNANVCAVSASGVVTAVGPGEAVITATSDPGEVSGTSTIAVVQVVTDVTVTPASANIAPGATQQFSASAEDANGNPVAGVNFVWVSSNQDAATIDPATGEATANAPGAAIITALGQGEPGSATLTVGGSGSFAQLVFSAEPSDITAGQALSPAVEIELQDASGNVVTTARDAVTLTIDNNAGGASLLGTVTLNAIKGVVTFRGVSLDKVGTGYTLQADAGATTATSAAFDVAPGAAAKLAFTQQPTDADGNVAFTPAVEVTILDQFDNVTTATDQVILSFDANPAGASLTGTTTVSASGGVATFSDLRVDKPAGGYALRARTGSLPAIGSDNFSVSLTFTSIFGGGGSGYGSAFTCGQTAGGTYCWGLNNQGQVGAPIDPTSLLELVPVLVQGGFTFTSVAMGEQHACGLEASGAVYCWGENFEGSLGNGTTGSVGTDSPVAVDLSGVTGTVVDIAAGVRHACALTDTGDIFCWGRNIEGTLGNGSFTASSTPVQVNDAGGTLTFKALAAGGTVTCGIILNDSAWCWGADGGGALGNGAAITTNQNVPSAVAGGVLFSQLIVGGGFSNDTVCGLDLTGAPGNLWCWGENSSGQVGDGTTTDAVQPVNVNASLRFTSVGVGVLHTCGITSTDGSTRCWGNNSSGQLGDGTNTNSPTQVTVTTSETFAAVTGGNQNACALTAAGGVFCWGRNSQGELGNGTTVSSNVPIQVKQQ